MTPEQRARSNRIGGLALHSQRDSRQVTAPARAAFLARFEREVDPDGLLDPKERARRADLACKRYFQTMAIKREAKRRAS